MADLILIRGLPGSGKSTKARALCKAFHAAWFEADHYFTDLDGTYRFDASKIAEAHSWCQQEALIFLESGENVVVSNTFTTKKEAEPYLKMAADFNANVFIMECRGNFGSVHNVPQDVIDKMKARWEQF